MYNRKVILSKGEDIYVSKIRCGREKIYRANRKDK